jgi:PAS domain S-box-containing protein
MNRASQTMRIDIPPDLREEMRHVKRHIRRRVDVAQPARAQARHYDPIGDSDFQELFQNVYDGALMTDINGIVVDANVRAADFLHYSRQELCGMSLLEVISGADADTIKTLQASLEKDRFILIQAHCSRKDGFLFPAEIAINRVRVREQPLLCCFIRDLTWRRQAEEMLRTINNAFQNSATGIAVTDQEGRMDYVNLATAKLWGLESPEEMKGLNLLDLLPDRTQAMDLVAAVHKGGNWSLETILTQPGTPPLHLRISAAANRDADENIVGIVLSFLDITDTKRAEEAEKKTERQRVMMESIGTACHHLGQPATVLLASLELMTRIGNSNKVMTAELLSSSMQAAESIRKMLHDLNDISEYKTTSYIEGQDMDGYSGVRILALDNASN